MEISAEMKSERAAGEIWLYFRALARGATFRRQHMNKAVLLLFLSLLIVGDFLHHGKPDHEEWHMNLAK